MGRRVSLQISSNGRVTIPGQDRQYFELDELNYEENEVWLDIEIHGVDATKHPDHKYASDPHKEEGTA